MQVAVPGKSSEKCDEGARHLAVAQASQFEDKESLKKAVNCYFNAIACDRNDPQGYVGAAYIVLLLGSNKSAMRYLEAALEVAPDNKDAQKLMAYAKEQVEQGNEGQEVIHEDEQQQQCHADGDVPSKGRNRTL
ncbi:unnamed protein product [Pedinophyceae sp. YPF-701]|nr:unnamed protein product [Pedinophyceae sp. YPF-701]